MRRICLDFRNNFSLPISPATCLRQVVENSKSVDETLWHLVRVQGSTQSKMQALFSPALGDVWEVDEIYLPFGKENFPLIVVKDLKTCFLPAANLARVATIKTITEALVCAKDIAHKCPIELRGDGNPAYQKAVRRAFRHKTELTIHKKVGRMGQDQSIEGTFGAAVRNRIKNMRNLHSWQKSPIIIRGMILDYHFARPCEALGGRTPAEAAMAWNPIDGKRGWPALLQLAVYYEKTRLQLRSQVQVSSKNHRQITFNELLIVNKGLIRKDVFTGQWDNRQQQLSSF